jgi:hypothetical protein
MKRIMLLMAPVVVLGLVATADATTTTVKWGGVSHGQNVHLRTSTGNHLYGGIGLYHLYWDTSPDTKFPVLCIEIKEHPSGTWEAEIVDVEDAPQFDGWLAAGEGPPMGIPKADALAQLWKAYGPTYAQVLDDSWETSPTLQAGAANAGDYFRGLQLAAWEVVFEQLDASGNFDYGNLDPTSGYFYADNDNTSGNALPAYFTVAQNMLDSLDASDPMADLIALSAPGSQTGDDPLDPKILQQDFVTIVPEPVTMCGLFLGIASLGGYIRRRR